MLLSPTLTNGVPFLFFADHAEFFFSAGAAGGSRAASARTPPPHAAHAKLHAVPAANRYGHHADAAAGTASTAGTAAG